MTKQHYRDASYLKDYQRCPEYARLIYDKAALSGRILLEGLGPHLGHRRPPWMQALPSILVWLRTTGVAPRNSPWRP